MDLFFSRLATLTLPGFSLVVVVMNTKKRKKKKEKRERYMEVVRSPEWCERQLQCLHSFFFLFFPFPFFFVLSPLVAMVMRATSEDVEVGCCLRYFVAFGPLSLLHRDLVCQCRYNFFFFSA